MDEAGKRYPAYKKPRGRYYSKDNQFKDQIKILINKGEMSSAKKLFL